MDLESHSSQVKRGRQSVMASANDQHIVFHDPPPWFIHTGTVLPVTAILRSTATILDQENSFDESST